jgi:hypothetical protein
MALEEEVPEARHVNYYQIRAEVSQLMIRLRQVRDIAQLQ